MFIAKLTNNTWTRYFDTLHELTAHLYTAYYSWGAIIFYNAKPTYFYGRSGSVMPYSLGSDRPNNPLTTN